jgi:hypothetical protein
MTIPGSPERDGRRDVFVIGMQKWILFQKAADSFY